MRLSILLCALLALPVASAWAFEPGQKKEIEQIIRQYIMDNPSILFEAADKHQANMIKQAEEKAEKALHTRAKDLFETKEHPILGNAKAGLSVVEFFDYNCGYCKQVFGELQTATKDNQDIKIILIDTPILGASSLLAAQWSVAAHHLGKGVEFHTALMKFQGPKDETTLTMLAKQVGLDPEKVKTQAAEPATEAQISKNMELFQELGLTGTPAFAMPDQVLRGVLTAPALTQLAKDYAAKNKPLKK